MSSLLMLLVVVVVVNLAALPIPSHAEIECGLPYTPPTFIQGSGLRSTRQAEPSTSTSTATATANSTSTNDGPVPYSSCGAVVISDRFLLTAAYCVLDPLKPVISVRLGDLDLSLDGEANSQPADYDIERIIIHPNFSKESLDAGIRYNDLAMLKTVRKIEFNQAVYPYCITRTRPTPGTTVIASGYGYINETHTPTHLQEGELKVMAPEECEEEYRSKGKEDLLKQAYPNLLQGAGIVCAGYPGRGVCKGDEGGPLMREDASGRRFLEGIISFSGDVCGSDVMPGVSVSIADNYDFIVDVIESA